MVHLKKITEDNFLDAFNLRLAKGQESYVSHPVRSLAQAYVYRDQCQPFGIYNEDKMVGYVMVVYDYDIPEYDIWHMMLDASSQGKGYGSAALTQVIDYIETKPFGDSDRVTLTCKQENQIALKLYHRAGFVETGVEEDGEIELSQILGKKFVNAEEKSNKVTIRRAKSNDLSRIAEIFVLNNRIHYFPIFQDPEYSFSELQVVSAINHYFGKEEVLSHTYVFDDGLIKGFIQIEEKEIVKLYVDPFFQKEGIGHALLQFAMEDKDAAYVWALEKNIGAISFYKRHEFCLTGKKKYEEGTTEYLVELALKNHES